ncbi:nucleotidyltransferase domain-containing protein [Ensifer sp. ENS05]|nr:nucleotidyltransferase domain-containing protein [Ensifer sp. ENS05]
MSSVDFLLSQRQQNVLRALILQGERRLSVSDLIRIAGPGNGATQRVLDSFEKAGVVTREARGNQRLYSANKKHPIYPELRSICLKTFGLAGVISDELAKFAPDIKTAFVFGSIAKGEERADSDVDLMVVGDVDYFELGQAVENLKRALGRDIHLNLYTPAEWNDLQYDRVIRTINSEPRIMVAGHEVAEEHRQSRPDRHD